MCIQFLDRYEGILPNLPRSYGRICCVCGRDTTYSRDGTPVWYKYKDENKNHTGEWTCHNCNGKKKGYKFRILRCRLCQSFETRIRSNDKPIWIRDLDINQKFTGEYICYKCYYQTEKKCYKCGGTNRINREYINKSWNGRFICSNCRTDYRNKNLDLNSVLGIGYMTEALVAKFLGIKTCFDMTDKFNHRSFDIYEHDDYGKINVKASSFIDNGWYFHINRNKKCDFFFCICYDKDRKHIIRVYIFPNEEYISNKTILYINIHDIKYDFFREDEKSWDDLFHTLKMIPQY